MIVEFLIFFRISIWMEPRWKLKCGAPEVCGGQIGKYGKGVIGGDEMKSKWISTGP